MALPLFDGAAHVTTACAFPACAETSVGAPGRPKGVTAVAALLSAPSPTAFVAYTLNVYAVPFARPVTVADVPFTLTTADGTAGESSTVYPVS